MRKPSTSCAPTVVIEGWMYDPRGLAIPFGPQLYAYALIRQADLSGEPYRLGSEGIRRNLGISSQTAKKALRDLRERGLVTIDPSPSPAKTHGPGAPTLPLRPNNSLADAARAATGFSAARPTVNPDLPPSRSPIRDSGAEEMTLEKFLSAYPRKDVRSIRESPAHKAALAAALREVSEDYTPDEIARAVEDFVDDYFASNSALGDGEGALRYMPYPLQFLTGATGLRHYCALARRRGQAAAERAESAHTAKDNAVTMKFDAALTKVRDRGNSYWVAALKSGNKYAMPPLVDLSAAGDCTREEAAAALAALLGGERDHKSPTREEGDAR